MKETLTHIVWVDLTNGKNSFAPFVANLAAKMKADGHEGLIAYNVFFDDNDDAAIFVITYENAEAFMAHHDIIAKWEEIPQGMKISQVTGMSFLGPRSAALDNWISSRPFPFKVGLLEHHAAGFIR